MGNNIDYIEHYGVKGMKWYVTNDDKKINKPIKRKKKVNKYGSGLSRRERMMNNHYFFPEGVPIGTATGEGAAERFDKIYKKRATFFKVKDTPKKVVGLFGVETPKTKRKKRGELEVTNYLTNKGRNLQMRK